ncbi:MAG TPA: hypothetical protein DD727_09960 [Clostridiales bacterium]|nr:hypothetical protein [Clostridiales bacterium]
MSQKIYRVGIVGCGMIAAAHAKAYKMHERTELAALADINPEHLLKFKDKWSVSEKASYTDHLSMLNNEKLDIVSVCTWHGSHAEISIDCAMKGISGIICEKPMATNVGEAKDMLAAAKANKTKLTVEHNRRYSFGSNKARELIAEGQIGKPQIVLVRTQSGMLNWATHVIDQTRYLLGDPETDWVIAQVERKTDRHERMEPAEDRAAGIICFKDGTHFVLECDLPGPEMDHGPNTPIVIGTEGQIVVGSTVKLLNKNGFQEFASVTEEHRAGYIGHIDDLISWMEGQTDQHRCSGDQALHDIEIMMAMYESLRIKGVVSSPLKTRSNPLKEMLSNGELSVQFPGRYDIRLPYWN